MTDDLPIHLAVVETPAPTLPNSALPTGTRQMMGGMGAVFAAVFAVIGLCLIWAVFIRKPDTSRKRGALRDGPASSDAGRSGGRRRRRSSKERPRNPTLAETGGLPPRGAGDTNVQSP
jgi:hypothetical protein